MSRAQKKHATKPLPAPDALEMLTEDHRSLKKLFDEFRHLVENDDTNYARKDAVVQEACDLLCLHTMLEERIFYPAVLHATHEEEMIAEAKVEHESVQELIDQLRQMEAGDELFDAKFIVLGEIFMLHVKEEEHVMFEKARKAELDFRALGRRMQRMREKFVVDLRVTQTMADVNGSFRDAAAILETRQPPGEKTSVLVPPPGLR